MKLKINCPDLTTISRRLKALNITVPRYRKHDRMDDNIAAIAIDSTGLKQFGFDEWHQEKHKVNARRSWRKAHFSIDDNHYIQAATLTDRFTHDDEAVDELLLKLIKRLVNLVAMVPMMNRLFMRKCLRIRLARM